MLQRIFRIITSNARDNSVLLLASFVIGGGTGLFFLTGNNEPRTDLTPDVVISESPTPTPSISKMAIKILSPTPSPTKSTTKKTSSPTPTTTTTAPTGGGGGGGGGTIIYNLTVTSGTGGTVETPSSAGTNTWWLIATPDSGYDFGSWSCTSAGNPTTITLTADTTCTATFTPVVSPSPSDTVVPSPT